MYPSMSQLLAFSAVGFLVVMFVLLIQSLLTAAIGKAFVAFEKFKNNTK